MFAQSHAAGMVVAVVRGDEVMVQGFGRIRPGRSGPPDGETLVRLGSISKLFTGETMAALAVEGRLRTTDPLQRWAPVGVRVPQAAGSAPINLVNLASHTSGLPRLAGIDYQPNPAQAAAARWRWLARASGGPPGRNAVYSNIAYDILADALSLAAGEPYVRAMARRITGPLGLRDTTPSPDAQQCRRLMDGGTAGAWAACRDTAANAGSGGLYSTADDMAQWMRHELGLTGPAPALRISQAIYFPRASLSTVDGLDRAGPASGVGLGWIELAPTVTHPRLIEKTGGGWGFMTYVALAPGRRAGIFVAVSSHEMSAMPPLAARTNDLVGSLVR